MPTFGKTSNGASSSNSSATRTSASLATPATNGTITAGHVRISITSGTTTTKMALYADSGGSPGALLAESDPVVISNTTEAQIDYVFTGANQVAVVGGTSYWVAVAWQDPGTPSVTISRDNTASGRVENLAYAPNPFGTATAQTGPIDAWIEYAEGTSFVGGRLMVEVAWGADLSADPDTWVWSDITTDVRAEPGISTRLGRSDESSKANPAELSVVLDNTTAAYSLSGRSENYPYVRKNTPVRVRVDPGSGFETVFFGGATGWSPSWDSMTGTVPVVTLSASGTLRRLSQGSDTTISPIRRYLVNEPDVVSYWPCEEGAAATFLPAAVGSNPMLFSGIADLASCTDYPASQPLPTTNGNAGQGGSYYANVDTYTPAADYSQGVRMCFTLPSNGLSNEAVILQLEFTGGTVGIMQLMYKTGQVLEIRAYSPGYTSLLASANATFNTDGIPGLVSLEMFQASGTVHFGLNFLGLGATNYGSIPGDPSFSGSLGLISTVKIDPSAVCPGVGFGHVAVLKARSATDPLTDTYLQLNGYPNETITSGRLQRICDENSIPLTLYGGTADSATSVDYAGAQAIDNVVNILRRCEDQERGTLWDGLTSGLAYTTRRRQENSAAVLTVDASELVGFGPVDDDQRTRNKVTVDREGGASFIAEDVDGPMGTTAVGTYADSLTVNSYQDAAARDIAGWLVHTGTIEGYRYPTLTLNLRAVPSLAEDVLALFPGARVDVTGIDAVFDSSAEDTTSLIVEGIKHDIGPEHWTVELACSPFQAWRIGVSAATSSDTDPNLMRLVGDGSTLSSSYSAGVTSVSVTTTYGVWTTAADDYPMYLNVGGVKVRATACSGASSPQTFTVDALPQTITSGSTVTVFEPTSLGL